MSNAAILELVLPYLDTSGGPDSCWPHITRNGTVGKTYYSIMLPGTGRLQLVTRLLLDAPRDRNVCHTCDNPPCCNPAHLFLGTQRENCLDSHAKGRSPRQGTYNSRARLTEDDVREIRRLRDEGWIHADIAEQYGLTRSAVSHLLRGMTWSHVDG